MHQYRKLTTLASLLTAMACGAKPTDPNTDADVAFNLAAARAATTPGATPATDSEDDEACTVDADCDSDEVCDLVAGVCSDRDGEDDRDDAVCGADDQDDEDEDRDDADDQDEARRRLRRRCRLRFGRGLQQWPLRGCSRSLQRRHGLRRRRGVQRWFCADP